MQKNQINQTPDNSIAQLLLTELRQKWAECWGIQPHVQIGRQMLEKSLEYKLRELRGEGLTPAQQKRLDNLVTQYKRDPETFEQGPAGLKPGTKLVRAFKGEKYVVLVKPEGFEYKRTTYTSLSEIASVITGTRWNGWVFFGLKKRKRGKT
jgi:hypothetical protein